MYVRTILSCLGLTIITASAAAAALPHAGALAQQKLIEHLARTETHMNIVERHLGAAALHQAQAVKGGDLPAEVLRARKLIGHRHLLPITWEGYWRRVPGTVFVENGGIVETVRDGRDQQEAEVAAIGDDLSALWAQRTML